MQRSILAVLISTCFGTVSAWAAPPVFHTSTCSVSVDNQRLDTVLTPDGNDLRDTIAYEPATKLFHFWGFTAPDASYPSSASALGAVVHATSTDGIHFVSDGKLSYGIGSANYTDYGATIDPPLNFLRTAYDSTTGTWKLFAWTDAEGSSVGQYNYNTSVDDLGSVASNTNVVHQGPLSTPVSGNHDGAFGLVDDQLYLRVDNGPPLAGAGLGGGDGRFNYTDGIPAATGAELNEADLFTGTPYCWGLYSVCGVSNPAAAYVHNAGRTLRQNDGTLGTYYTFRHWDGSRADQQLWYVESSDNGVTWSAPVGVFPAGSTITIDGQPIDSAADTGNFSSAEMVQAPNLYRAYFSTQDSNGNYVLVSAAGGPSDTIFSDGFDGCD